MEYSKELKSIIRKLIENKEKNILGTEMLLIYILDTNCVLAKILKKLGIRVRDIKDTINSFYVIRKEKDKTINGKLKELLEKSIIYCIENKEEEVNVDHLSIIMLEDEKNFAYELLLELEIDIDEVKAEIEAKLTMKEQGLLVNISKNARNGNIQSFIGRKFYKNEMKQILSRKKKNNILIVGNAGVGKTSLVEGYAKDNCFIKDEPDILSLNLSSLLSGTKYRGDFEEKIQDVISQVSNKNSILYIDEIHTIVGTGSSEGTLDVANILKPILTSGEIKFIGSTTIDEYNKYFEKDRALARRFMTIFLEEPTPKETKEILIGLKNEYQDFHNIKISTKMIDTIIEESKKVENRSFPDKALDLLDNSMVYAKNNNSDRLKNIHIKKTLMRNENYKFKNSKIKDLELRKYVKRKELNLSRKTLLSVLIDGDNHQYVNELKEAFQINEEMVKTIDLSTYKDSFSISSLIGSPSGYVGHQEGGSLTEHIRKYQRNIIVFNNFSEAHSTIKNFIKSCLNHGVIEDMKGNTISLRNTVILINNKLHKNNIVGYVSKDNQSKKDELLNLVDISKKIESKNKEIKDYEKLKKLGYNIVLESTLSEKEVEEKILNIVTFKPPGKYIV